MNSICQLSGAVWGGSTPLSLVRDATVHFRTGRKKKRSLDSQLCWFVTRRLPLVGLQMVLPECPELPWFNLFLSPFLQVP